MGEEREQMPLGARAARLPLAVGLLLFAPVALAGATLHCILPV